MKDLDKVNIIITSEDNPSGFSSLNKLDVKVLHFPMIKTIPYSEIKYFDIKKTDFIIFTSKKGVKYFFENQEYKNYDFNSIKFICLGKKTEERLNEYNFESVYTCKRNYSEMMCEELRESGVIDSKNVLLVQGNLANENLVNCLKRFSNAYRRDFYKTLQNKSENKGHSLEESCLVMM